MHSMVKSLLLKRPMFKWKNIPRKKAFIVDSKISPHYHSSIWLSIWYPFDQLGAPFCVITKLHVHTGWLIANHYTPLGRHKFENRCNDKSWSWHVTCQNDETQLFEQLLLCIRVVTYGGVLQTYQYKIGNFKKATKRVNYLMMTLHGLQLADQKVDISNAFDTGAVANLCVWIYRFNCMKLL